MPDPIVSAVVLNYRTPQQTVGCVQALLKQGIPPRVTLSSSKGDTPVMVRRAHHDTLTDWLEIIVVDNHSEDDSVGVLRNRLATFPAVRIVETPKNLGFGAGYNRGMRAARGRYILLDNPTKKLAEGSLARIVEAMEADPTLGVIGPKLIQDDGTIRDSARAFPDFFDVIIKRTALQHFFRHRMTRYRQLDRDPETPRDTDWAIGGCLLIRRELLDKIGGFDPRFFLFFEDMDLCRRAWEAGYRVRYLPQAVATDKKRRLSEGNAFSLLLSRAGRAHIASGVKYFWKWRKMKAGRAACPSSP